MTWITAQEVADRLNLPQPDQRCIDATDAAIAYVERRRSDLRLQDGTFNPDADVVEGTKQYAMTIYTSRGSGISAYGDAMGDYTPSIMPALVQRLIGVKRPVIG